MISHHKKLKEQKEETFSIGKYLEGTFRAQPRIENYLLINRMCIIISVALKEILLMKQYQGTLEK